MLVAFKSTGSRDAAMFRSLDASICSFELFAELAFCLCGADESGRDPS